MVPEPDDSHKYDEYIVSDSDEEPDIDAEVTEMPTISEDSKILP